MQREADIVPPHFVCVTNFFGIRIPLPLRTTFSKTLRRLITAWQGSLRSDGSCVLSKKNSRISFRSPKILPLSSLIDSRIASLVLACVRSQSPANAVLLKWQPLRLAPFKLQSRNVTESRRDPWNSHPLRSSFLNSKFERLQFLIR